MDTFAISLSGLEFQKLRLETVARNFANSQNTRAAGTELYQPLEAIAFNDASQELAGVVSSTVIEQNRAPVKSHEPGHPDADLDGFVTRPGVNPVDEMITLMTSVRTYQANVQALNAAKKMAQLALETGK
ncbi:flagellar basal body rod protein FlgC [Parendozoicomonas haliclonae]|uniref:Flagellar basal-body rod protein FlgC n=1 Tax=Parendozoicomonas haliclonae TaxID=1960125 RepID=A0A1X7AP60_9GAMM|nr:flagellar basal body rod protein FlgC [Parendozoicomonas haliclonae]SMA49880.1 Flagellar basal-body rod protein FlgC [Parendozoicomonas haliclonae]